MTPSTTVNSSSPPTTMAGLPKGSSRKISTSSGISFSVKLVISSLSSAVNVINTSTGKDPKSFCGSDGWMLGFQSSKPPETKSASVLPFGSLVTNSILREPPVSSCPARNSSSSCVSKASSVGSSKSSIEIPLPIPSSVYLLNSAPPPSAPPAPPAAGAT